ncbi:MAG: divergent polysaccharide deacetylase family protein [Firmicutes bacterium]|jgi:polysaccharide deacetylase 2 family uncharacterized protein YibQ|nr:divergent polysaccharide deacetylase family protein [Bacillota bacterium]
MVIRLRFVLAVGFSLLTMILSGCGGGDLGVISHESGRIIHDYTRRSDRVAGAVRTGLESLGLLDSGTVAGAHRELELAPAAEEKGTYLRWSVTSYTVRVPVAKGGKWPDQAVFDEYRRAIERAASSTDRPWVLPRPGEQETAEPGAPVVFRVGFSLPRPGGRTAALEAARVVLEPIFHSSKAIANISEPDVSEAPEPSPAAKPALQPREAPLLPKPAGGKPALLAIVIDDLGYGVPGTAELMELHAPITVAILPGGTHAAKEAEMARERGYGVILHQPMEALDGSKNPGPAAISVDMSDESIRRTLQANLALLPAVDGVSNHMGSRATSDPRVMRVVLEEVGRRGLYFFDSYTTSGSVVSQVAAEVGTPVLVNAKFLDSETSETYVMDALRSAAKIALARGSAAAIGHVRPATIRALAGMIPELQAAGIRLVRLSDLVPEAGRGREPLPEPRKTPSPPLPPPAPVPVQPSEPDVDTTRAQEPAVAPKPAVEPETQLLPEPRETPSPPPPAPVPVPAPPGEPGLDNTPSQEAAATPTSMVEPETQPPPEPVPEVQPDTGTVTTSEEPAGPGS